jgi:hypothetical protein
MRKLLVFVLTFVVTSVAMPIEFSWSILYGIGITLEGATNTTNDYKETTSLDIYLTDEHQIFDWSLDVPLIVDVTFVELGIGLWAGKRSQITNWSETDRGKTGSYYYHDTGSYSDDGDIWGGVLIAFLKYPFQLNTFILSPMAGIEYRPMFGLDTESEDLIDNHKKWGAIWYKLGIAFDTSRNDGGFNRFEFLYGFREYNDYEKYLMNTFGSSAVGTSFTITIKMIASLVVSKKHTKSF